MRLSILLLLFFAYASTASAQVKKILHQSFEIEDFNNIKLDLAGEYEIEDWAGNAILIETNIELYSASRDLYNFFKEKGRYDVQADTTDSLITLQSVDLERKPIRTKKGEEQIECFEIIRVKVLIPEDFDIIDKNTLVRVDPEMDVSNQ